MEGYIPHFKVTTWNLIDNLSGIQLLQAPSGPWRTRHLRLRSHVLRERISRKLWDIEHVPGKDLCADLLTKSITQVPSWRNFKEVVGMRDAVVMTPEPHVNRVVVKTLVSAAAAALGVVSAFCTEPHVRTASIVVLAALSFFSRNLDQTASSQSTTPVKSNGSKL